MRLIVSATISIGLDNSVWGNLADTATAAPGLYRFNSPGQWALAVKPPAGVTLRLKIGMPVPAAGFAVTLFTLVHVATVSPSFRLVRLSARHTSSSVAARARGAFQKIGASKSSASGQRQRRADQTDSSSNISPQQAPPRACVHQSDTANWDSNAPAQAATARSEGEGGPSPPRAIRTRTGHCPSRRTVLAGALRLRRDPRPVLHRIPRSPAGRRHQTSARGRTRRRPRAIAVFVAADAGPISV